MNQLSLLSLHSLCEHQNQNSFLNSLRAMYISIFFIYLFSFSYLCFNQKYCHVLFCLLAFLGNWEIPIQLQLLVNAILRCHYWIILGGRGEGGGGGWQLRLTLLVNNFIMLSLTGIIYLGWINWNHKFFKTKETSEKIR